MVEHPTGDRARCRGDQARAGRENLVAAIHRRRGSTRSRGGIIPSATYLYVTRDGKQANTSPASVATRPAGEAPASLAAFTVEENNYLRTASILQELLDSQQAVLAPETIAQLKASLRTIDEAILEARNALARDPANRVLMRMLSASYRQKVDLLRRTTEMTRGS